MTTTIAFASAWSAGPVPIWNAVAGVTSSPVTAMYVLPRRSWGHYTATTGIPGIGQSEDRLVPTRNDRARSTTVVDAESETTNVANARRAMARTRR
jgi:hypothetical protein